MNNESGEYSWHNSRHSNAFREMCMCIVTILNIVKKEKKLGT